MKFSFFRKDSDVIRVRDINTLSATPLNLNYPQKNPGICRACGFQVEDRTPSRLCEDCIDYWGVDPEDDVE